MGYSYFGNEEKRLQRKLIPLNIFVAILALVAAISLIFAPILTVDLGALANALTESASEGSEEESGENMLAMFGDLSDAKISISAYDASKVAFADKGEKAKILADTYLIDTDLIGNVMNNMLSIMFIETVGLLTENVNLSELNSSFEAINNANSKTEFTTAVENYVDKVSELAGESVSDSDKEQLLEILGEAYDLTVEKVEEENFSIEAMVCVMLTESLNEAGLEDVEFTTYSGLIECLTSDIEIPAEANELLSNLSGAFKSFDEYAGSFGYVFYVMAFFAGIWGILFLFALLHILGRNKRFTMWYAKLFGGIPCLLFGGITLAASQFGEAISEMIGVNISLTGVFGTMTWISGICYLLMWLVSIFWAFPIKHKIRKLRKSDY